jgi:II/X family phage/plasmid replication protein
LVLSVSKKKAIPSGVVFFCLDLVTKWSRLVTIWSQNLVVKLIDWITAIIPCHHPEQIYGGRIASISPYGEIEWQVEKKMQVVGSHESNLNIKSVGRTELYFDGNPVKWLQGHNLFGSNDLIGLIEEVMQKLIPILNLTPVEADIDAWRLGHYELKRVDCTAMWELPRRSDVRAWLRAAEFQSKSRHGRPITTGSTLYFGKNSRRWSIKFYSKGDELEARVKGHKLPYEIPERDKLIKWADNKLRGELTLRSVQLKEANLNLAANWTESIVIERLINHIETLDMAEQFSLTLAILDGLPSRLIAVYKLWKEGEDLRGLYPKATFYRYRAELLKHGIDINVRQPAKPENVIPLVRVLRPEAISQIPEWALGTSLYFEPKQA